MAILRGFPPSNAIHTGGGLHLLYLVHYWESQGIIYDRKTLVEERWEGHESPAPWNKDGLSRTERAVAEWTFWNDFEKEYGYDPRG